MSADVSAWHRLAAGGGHAGPDSSASYIHVIEEALAKSSRCCRPNAWLNHHSSCLTPSVFEPLVQGQCVERGAIPDRMKSDTPPATSTDIGICQRSEILFAVAQSYDFDAVASRYQIDKELVVAVVKELAEALVLTGLAAPASLVSTLRQCKAIRAYVLWARASTQEKYQRISQYLDDQVSKGAWRKLTQFWRDWTDCQSGNFLNLGNPRPALRLTKVLLEIGIAKNSLAISSAKGSPFLDAEILRLEIPKSPEAKRRGDQADHRLFLVDGGLKACEAKGATISVLGFHWWMLVTGSLLVSKGEL